MRLNLEQLKDLSDELFALMKQHTDARSTEVFVRMNEQEIKAFDLRAERISRIHVILGEHDAKAPLADSEFVANVNVADRVFIRRGVRFCSSEYCAMVSITLRLAVTP